MGRARLGTLIAAAAGVAGCRLGAAGDLVGPLPGSSTAGGLGALIQVTGKACNTAYAASTWGHVVYASESLGHIYRVEARPGADAEDLTSELDRLSKGNDGAVNVTADGEWLVVTTTRFGCGAQQCLAVVAQNACSAQVIIDGTGNPIEADGFPAIANLAGGDLVVVYPVDNGGTRNDLYAVHKHDGAWDVPVSITKTSTLSYNAVPTISNDGTKVLFDCGTNSYSGGDGTSICEVGTDGTAFRVVHGPADGPTGDGSWPLHKANYAPDGAIVFEGEWPHGGERIWQYPAGSATPALVNDQTDPDGNPIFNDDNTPCVLGDGRVVSLWLQRDGNVQGYHELKVMNADGTAPAMLVINENTLDVGHGCSK
jgi:hypothetical protein